MKTGSEPMSVKKRCPECDEDYDPDTGEGCTFCGYTDDDDKLGDDGEPY